MILGKSAIWSVLSQALVSGSSFVLTLLIANEANATEFGKYVLLTSAILISTILPDSLLSWPLRTLLAQIDRSRVEEYLSTCYLCLVGLIIIELTTAIALDLIMPWNTLGFGSSPIPMSFFLAMGAYQFRDFVRGYLQAEFRTALLISMDTLFCVGSIGATWAVSKYGALEANKVLWVLSATGFASGLLGSLNILRILSRSTLDIAWLRSLHGPFFKWLFLGALGPLATNQATIFILGLQFGAIANATLEATRNVIAPVQLFITALSRYAAPKSATLIMNGQTDLFRFLRKLLIAGSLISGLYLLPVVFFPEVVLRLLFHGKYLDHISLVRWWSLAQIPLIAWSLLGHGFAAQRRHDIYCRILFYSGFLSLAIALILIPTMAESGAIAARICTDTAVAIAFAVVLTRGNTREKPLLPWGDGASPLSSKQ